MEAKHILVSCIVPYFNRRQFIPQMFASFEKQTFKDFEVIIVDDGSTDGSKEIINEYVGRSNLEVKYVLQNNSGPYVARNKGIELARGEYIALQDSDDEWPPYHLEKMMINFLECPKADWLFGGIRRINHFTKKVEIENTFFKNGLKHPVLKLRTKNYGNVKLINDDNLLSTAILHGLPCGTQSSVFRKRIFDSIRFDESFRTGFDRFFVILLLMEGYQVGYVTEIHQIYHIHDNHISLVAKASPEKNITNTKNLVRGYKSILDKIDKSKKNEINAVKHHIANLSCWILSVNYQILDNYSDAKSQILEAIKNKPLSLILYKSLFACYVKWFIFKLKCVVGNKN